MSKSPLVSLIVPVFNVESYLTQCLESIRDQDYQNLEILIIDDGSTDKSGDICDRYALLDTRAIVFHTENHGLAMARNIGLDKAKGDYITFLDSDDWMEPNAVSKLVECAQEYDSDIVVGGVYREWINKTEIANMPDKITVYDGEEALSELICEGYLRQFVWNKIYRASCFSKLRFPEGRLHEDMYVTYHVLYEAKRVVFITDVLFHYRMRKSGICNSKSLQRLIDFWQAWSEMYEFLRLKGKPYRTKCLQQSILAGALIWFQYAQLSQIETIEGMYNEVPVIERVSKFASEHFGEVIRGKYSITDKVLCALLLSKSPIYMELLNKLYVHRKKFMKKSDIAKAVVLYE